MLEHLTQKQVEDYCRQQLRPAELLSVSDHLGECETCRQWTETTLNGDAALSALRSQIFGEAADVSREFARSHLTFEQTAGYADGNLTGEELRTIADHLTVCERCALAVDDLRAFRTEIGPALEREYRPATVPFPAESWWRRTVASLTDLFRGSPGLAFGSALAILLVAVTGWLILRTPQREPTPEIVVSPAPPSQPAPAPAVPEVPVQLVAQLNDGGGRLTLDQKGNLSGADELPAAYRSLLKETLTDRRIERSSQLRGLARPSSSLMSTDKQRIEFSVIEPVGRVLLTDRPAFRWSRMEGATNYVVEVYDGKFNLVASSEQLTGNSWTAPALPRGEIYAWQVKATKDGQEFKTPEPPAPQARFRILDQAKANELEKAKRAYGSHRLTMGLLYAEAGLLREAEQEMRALQRANPDSEVVRTLLNQVRTLQR